MWQQWDPYPFILLNLALSFHQKIDQLRETEVPRLTQSVSELTALLQRSKPGPA